MLKYRAVFFDRDNTLLRGVSNVLVRGDDLRKAKIEIWSSREFVLTPDEMMDIFWANRPPNGHKSVEEEVEFFHCYWRELLIQCGVTDHLEERAEELHQMTWLKGARLFPETLEILDWCQAQGLRMGVISDTSPSLPLTLEAAGIGGYFQCAICSDLVGVMKPDPKIYQTALDALGVTAEESVYVDDYDVEADGARAMGFTAFHLDRTQPGDGMWRISSLLEIKNYLEYSQDQ